MSDKSDAEENKQIAKVDKHMKAGRAHLVTDQAPITDSTGTVRPSEDKKGMATTDNTEPITRK